MPPNSTKLWQCGNHPSVHLAVNSTQKKAYTIIFGCKDWKSKPKEPQPFLITWKCGNHTNPVHVARTKDERKNLTKKEKCKNWSPSFID
jgi:hypothetical protein